MLSCFVRIPLWRHGTSQGTLHANEIERCAPFPCRVLGANPRTRENQNEYGLQIPVCSGICVRPGHTSRGNGLRGMDRFVE
jgi:hypothetical protein